jgi:ATP-dependent DNA helicase 2 subunit 2
MPIEDTYSPAIHRINQAIRTRAVQPDKPIDPPAEILIKWSNPPQELIKKATPELQKLIEAADVKRGNFMLPQLDSRYIPSNSLSPVELKVRGKRNRDQITPLSGLDVNSLLDNEKPRAARKITMENSIPDFRQLLPATVSTSEVVDLVDQMAQIIYKMVADIPTGGSIDRVAENMRVLRTDLLDLEMPDIYNDFIRDFKLKLVSGELFKSEFASNKRELWFLIKSTKLGLIDKEVSEHSTISKEEAAQVSTYRCDKNPVTDHGVVLLAEHGIAISCQMSIWSVDLRVYGEYL